MRARFVKSAVGSSDFPRADRPEFAFVGRSNVGKSSLLNALVREKVARTSRTPGRTQVINFFDVDAHDVALRFVDLPGYGFAKAPSHVQSQWPLMVEQYLQADRPVLALLLLVDLRHEPQPADFEAIAWIKDLKATSGLAKPGQGEPGRPPPLGSASSLAAATPASLVLVGTKADRVPKSKQKLSLQKAAASLGLSAETSFLTSADSGLGLDALRTFLRRASADRRS